MPARSAIAAMLCLAFALTLAACGGGGESQYQYWNATTKSYYQVDGGKLYQHWCVTLEGEPVISAYSRTKMKQVDYWIKVDEESRNFKSGDTVCSTWEDTPGYSASHIQTKENEFSIGYFRASEDLIGSYGDVYKRASIDTTEVDRDILSRAVVLGLNGGFKYGVFDNIEEHRRVDESRVTGSTSATNASEAGIVSSLYNTQYGVAFGDSATTTTLKSTGSRIEVQRKHTVRFYHDKPSTDAYFDLSLVAKSVLGYPAGSYFEIVHAPPSADYYR